MHETLIKEARSYRTGRNEGYDNMIRLAHRLADALEEAAKDSGRLDWLDRATTTVMDKVVSQWEEEDDLRAAIDAAKEKR